MHDALRAALTPVLDDVCTTTLALVVEDSDWSDDVNQPSAFLRAPDGTGAGVSVWLPDPELEQRVSVADQVQEQVVESIGGTASNWPICPEHPTTHPMTARAVDGVACWVCPASGTPAARVGSLGSTSAAR
ncbi:hypothetical protein [Nocardioides conyzicola]|uniref:Uncharacterized protein n=1 Tax=Nocardioides conyzicola TaxID=1651781 RepID=A0ABP8Y4E7_9ACTN